MQSKHNHKLVFSGIDLVGAKLAHSFEAYDQVRDELQSLMIESGYISSAPFLWVGMVFRYGLKNETDPHYRRIDKKDGELELAKELDMRVLLTVDEEDPRLLKEFFEVAALDALIHAGKKYKLKTDALEKRRDELGIIPDWEYNMEAHPELLFEKYRVSKERSRVIH